MDRMKPDERYQSPVAIEVRGARVHNLKNIDVECFVETMPRDSNDAVTVRLCEFLTFAAISRKIA